MHCNSITVPVRGWGSFLLLFAGAASGATTAADLNPPVTPAQGWQLGIYLITAFCLLLAAAGGVGAVAMLVTFYMVLGGPENVPAGMAVGMICCVLAGTGVAHIAYYSTQRHPVFKDRALIDPNLLIIITAPGVGGVALGGLANRVAPVWVVYMCLALVMIVVSYSLICKAIEAYHKQKAATQVKHAASVVLSRSVIAPGSRAAAAFAAAAAAVAADDGASCKCELATGAVRLTSALRLPSAVRLPSALRLPSVDDVYFFSVDASERGEFRQSQAPAQLLTLQSFGRWESFIVLQKKNPLKRWRAKHFLLVAVMVLAAALPGTAALVHCGSGLWFLAVLSGLPLLAGVVAFMVAWLAMYVRKTARQQQQQQHKAAAKDKVAAKDRAVPAVPAQQWTTCRLICVPCACLVAGSLNGFIGTGGAFILARIALAVDTHPAAMAATLQSSAIGWAASGLGIYGLLGQVPWKMGGILIMLAAVSTALGHATVSQYIKRTGKFWVILAILAVFAVVTAALAVYNMAVVMQAVANRPTLWTATGTLCHKVTL